MEMTNEEICRNYRQAKYRQRQIKILADENLCSVEEIRKILIDGGALVPKPPKPKKTASVSGSEARSESDAKPVKAPADWKDSLKALTEYITELKQRKTAIEKEISEIYQALGDLCNRD